MARIRMDGEMKTATWSLAIAAAAAAMTGGRSGAADISAEDAHVPLRRRVREAPGGKLTVERRLDDARDSPRFVARFQLADDRRHRARSRVAIEPGVGTKRGRFATADGYRRREYFAGLRWLPDDRVTGIGRRRRRGVDRDAKGFSKDRVRPMTLAEKSQAFVGGIQERHVRWGLTADSQLRVPGDLSTNRTRSTDNDGLWTAMYVAAEAFRFKVTGDRRCPRQRATRHAGDRAPRADHRHPGFPARSFIKPGTTLQPEDGEWHDTPDKPWRWKGTPARTRSSATTSSIRSTSTWSRRREKPALRGVIDRITNHILDNDYQLVDVDGQRTRWGWWAPELIWDDPDETGLRALHILSHLRVALS